MKRSFLKTRTEKLKKKNTKIKFKIFLLNKLTQLMTKILSSSLMYMRIKKKCKDKVEKFLLKKITKRITETLLSSLPNRLKWK